MRTCGGPGRAKLGSSTLPTRRITAKNLLAGKTYRYRVEVQSIKHRVVPAADDELAKSVSEFSTLAELRAKLAGDLTERAKLKSEMAAKQALVEQLLRLHEFAVPEIMVEAQLEHKLERMLRQLFAQGIDPRQAQVDWHKLREESRPDAEKEVRASLLLSKIAEAEGLEVSEEEVDEDDPGDGSRGARTTGHPQDPLDTRRRVGYSEIYSPQPEGY